MRPTLIRLSASAHAASRAKTIGFIGLGQMGREMAFNLFSKRFAESADTQFVINDAIPEASVAFVDNFHSHYPEARINVLPTPAHMARASSTIITMLPSSPQVKQVYEQSSGILEGLGSLGSAERQALCIDSSTLDVDVARDVARKVIEMGAQMVDAPVSGGVTGAKAGTLSFLCGGTEAAYAEALPYLKDMGAKFFYCGPSGAGLGAKIMNNLILGVHQIVVGEAMLLGHHKLGLDPAVLANVINSSTGACWASSVNNPVPSALKEKSPPCERDYEGGFATALMLKDMGLATALGRSHGSPLPMSEAAEAIYRDALEKEPKLARKDFSSIYQFLSQQTH